MGFIVKNTTFPGLLDLLAPHSCRGCGRLGSVLCDRCKKYLIARQTPACPQCKNPHPAGEKCPECPELPLVYAFEPRGGIVGALIHDYKYSSLRAAAPVLAELYAAIIPDDLPASTVLVPLPTSYRHIRARAFDHTLLISRHLSRLRGFELQPLLSRAKDTTQVGTDSRTRQKQAVNAYILAPDAKIDPDATHLLLDDIWTTGASMLAAMKIMEKAGAKDLRAAILAYSPSSRSEATQSQNSQSQTQEDKSQAR